MAEFGYSGTLNDPAGNIGQNFKQVSAFTLSEDGTVSSLSMYVDGAGGGSGTQVLRMVIYSDSAGSPNARMAVSDEVSITDGQGIGWVLFDLPADVPLTAGTYWLGFIAGANTNSARFSSAVLGNARKYRAETYSATPADPFGGGVTTDGVQLAVKATYSTVDNIVVNVAVNF